jgi:hypothetical protein
MVLNAKAKVGAGASPQDKGYDQAGYEYAAADGSGGDAAYGGNRYWATTAAAY